MTRKPRSGCKDIWNAFMCYGARYSAHDIPYCPTTAEAPPERIIPWDEAVRLYRRAMAQNEKHFHYPAFICFYLDDCKFDGPHGIWNNSAKALRILRHFSGAVTPDFSTYQDFPEPLKYYNTFRMRAFGYWLGMNGVAVINNVRWGTKESWTYCWDGLPHNSILAIGTVGGNPFRHSDRDRFETGLNELVRVLQPHTILVYGSSNYPCFERLKKQGISIITYPSHTSLAFERRSAE